MDIVSQNIDSLWFSNIHMVIQNMGNIGSGNGLLSVIYAVTGEFHTQRASNAENVSIWLRHHGKTSYD